MKQNASDKSGSGQRIWRKGERAKVSIFQTFRNAFHEGDARRANAAGASGEAEISARSLQRREGVSEHSMRGHLEADLNALLNTIQLGSVADLSDVPHVESSIVNFGFRDLSSVTLAEMTTHGIKDTIRQSLIDFEPRLVPESIDVQVLQADAEDNTRQRLSISVSADLTGDPIDIPMDFDADVDLSVGKLRMSKLRVQA